MLPPISSNVAFNQTHASQDRLTGATRRQMRAEEDNQPYFEIERLPEELVHQVLLHVARVQLECVSAFQQVNKRLHHLATSALQTARQLKLTDSHARPSEQFLPQLVETNPRALQLLNVDQPDHLAEVFRQVSENPHLLRHVPKQLRADMDLIHAAFERSPDASLHAPFDLFQETEFVADLIKAFPSLKENIGFVALAIAGDPGVYSWRDLFDDMNDNEFSWHLDRQQDHALIDRVLTLGAQYGKTNDREWLSNILSEMQEHVVYIMEKLPEEIRTDPRILLSAIFSDASAIFCTPQALRQDWNFMKIAIRSNPRLIALMVENEEFVDLLGNAQFWLDVVGIDNPAEWSTSDFDTSVFSKHMNLAYLFDHLPDVFQQDPIFIQDALKVNPQMWRMVGFNLPQE